MTVFVACVLVLLIGAGIRLLVSLTTSHYSDRQSGFEPRADLAVPGRVSPPQRDPEPPIPDDELAGLQHAAEAGLWESVDPW